MPRLKMFILCLMAVSSLAACGKPGGESAATAEKSVLSKWTSKESGNFFDFTGARFGEKFRITSVYADGAQCKCDFQFLGNEASGTFAATDCFYAGGGTAMPACSSLNSVGSYTKSSGELRVCDTKEKCSVFY